MKSNGLWGRDLEFCIAARAGRDLVMDLRHYLPLGVGMDDAQREDLVSRLFALLAARPEHGAAEALREQGRNKDAKFLQHLANHIQTLGEDIVTVAEAAGVFADVPIHSFIGS